MNGRQAPAAMGNKARSGGPSEEATSGLVSLALGLGDTHLGKPDRLGRRWWTGSLYHCSSAYTLFTVPLRRTHPAKYIRN